jgi:hypothetical protein
MATDSPSFESVENALRQLGAAEGPTGAHGNLCGLACVLGERALPLWIAALTGGQADDYATGGELTGVLDELASATCAALTDGQMSFMPMLPPDDAPLAARAEGLAEWCAGFMHGLGEAVAGNAAAAALEDDMTREIMADFADIARVTLDEDETDLEAEAAYTELVEFVRVSVQIVFEELHDLRQTLSAASMH